MADSDFVPGLEGVIAFETQIAEPDKEGNSLRYRGVDIEDLVGRVSFGNVWGLLVDNEFNPGLPPAEPFPLPVHSGDVRVDVQSALAMLSPSWGLRPLLDIDHDQTRDDLARASVMAMSYVAQSARGLGLPMVPQREIDKAATVVERFMIRWRGEPDPEHVKAVDAYFVSAAEHGMNASTFTARVIASTGADVAAALSGAVGAMSGPLHGGAPSRVLHMLEEVERTGDAEGYVRTALDSGQRLMGFGHRVYRAEDPRARVLRRTARELGAPRFEVAEELERAALNPKDYRFCGYAAAVVGNTLVRKGLMSFQGKRSWSECAAAYRVRLLVGAGAAQQSGKVVLDKEKNEEVLKQGAN